MCKVFWLSGVTLTTILSLTTATPVFNRPENGNLAAASSTSTSKYDPSSILQQLLSGHSITTANGTTYPPININLLPNNTTLTTSSFTNDTSLNIPPNARPSDPYIEPWGGGNIGFTTYGALAGGPWLPASFLPFWYRLEEDLRLMQLSQLADDYTNLPSDSWQLIDWIARVYWSWDVRSPKLTYLHMHHLVSALFRFLGQWGRRVGVESFSMYVTETDGRGGEEIIGSGTWSFPPGPAGVGGGSAMEGGESEGAVATY